MQGLERAQKCMFNLKWELCYLYPLLPCFSRRECWHLGTAPAGMDTGIPT